MQQYKKWFAFIFAAIAIVSLFYWQTKGEETAAVSYTENPKQEEQTEEEKESSVVVDIKGAVRNEGVYELPAGTRVKEAVEKAGGLLPEADTATVNLAQFVHDQMLVHIPRKGEKPHMPAATVQQKIAINIASKEELQNIPGIGPAKAERIIRYREEHGPFRKVEDLLEVEGIGEKSLEKIKEQIVVP
ncbi:MAG: helix-hairpin-helix domain-containing protein [Ectobacillus sp.]